MLKTLNIACLRLLSLERLALAWHLGTTCFMLSGTVYAEVSSPLKICTSESVMGFPEQKRFIDITGFYLLGEECGDPSWEGENDKEACTWIPLDFTCVFFIMIKLYVHTTLL